MQQVRDNDAYASQMLPYLERRFGKLEQSHSVLKDRFVDIHCLTVPFTKKDYAQSGVPVPEDAISQGLLGDLHGKAVYFVIGFADGDCGWRLHREQYEVRHTYTPTDGLPQIKSHTSILIKYLIDIIHDAEPEPEVSVEARIHHPEAIRQVADQDAGRHHQAQQSQG
jgi:hypothetical protein